MKLIASAAVVAATGLAVFAEPTQARLRRGPTGPAAQAALADALANIDLSNVDWSTLKGGPLSEYSYMNSRRFRPQNGDKRDDYNRPLSDYPGKPLSDYPSPVDEPKWDWSNLKGKPLSEYSYMNTRGFRRLNIDLSNVDWSTLKGGPLSEYSYMNDRSLPPPLRVGYGQPSQMPRRAEITQPVFEMASGNFRPPLCEYCDDDDDDLGNRRRRHRRR
jgi:hypothetical protein